MSIIPLASLSEKQLADLAVLHCAVMPTLLTDLGTAVVRRYYENALCDSKSIGFAVLSSDEKGLHAWVFGSPHPNELAVRLRDSFGWFALQMLRVAFTHPRALLELAQSALSLAQENSIEAGEIELTYIGVSPEGRGKGLGLALLKQFLAAAQEQGYARVTLSVETDNQTAIRMYEKVGFAVTKTFHEGRFERHRMSVVLNSQAAPEDVK